MAAAGALAGALLADSRSSFAVTTAHTLSACLDALSQASFDVILLDTQLSDSSSGLDAIRSIATAYPDAHICAMTTEEEPGFGIPLIRAGAEDYVLKVHIHTPLLGHFLRNKVQRFHLLTRYRADRQAEIGRREMQCLDAMAEGPGTPVSSRVYGGQSLRESAQAEFDRLTETYERLLHRAIEARVYKEGGSSPPDALIELARALGRLNGGPRDVVEVHTTAVRSLTAKTGVQRSRIVLEEGRILVLGLMGHLAAYYRSFHLGQPFRRR